MLALTGTTGKIGGATLDAILSEKLVPHSEIVICTSSDPEHSRWNELKSKGVTIRQSNYDDSESMEKAFSGCSKLFLVSTPIISMDFNDAPYGHGRERHHFAAIQAAQKAGVGHIYYTSLAFGAESEAGVMQAHLRTEAVLRGLEGIKHTIIREGLYNESWPLYFGYYNLKNDDRTEVVVAGDGLISWTSVRDLGLATALVVAESSTKFDGKSLYLSAAEPATLSKVAEIVSSVKGKNINLKVVSREEFEKFYSESGQERPAVKWWSSSYAALKQGECDIKDQTFGDLLAGKDRKPDRIEDTIKAMLTS